MANKDKRAKRAKAKAKQNRISKSKNADPASISSGFEGLELKSLTSEIISNEVPNFDSGIADYLEQFSFDDYAGNEMEIAIKNERSEIYRTIKTYGLKPFMDLISYLQEIGLRDLYQDVQTNNSGYDAVFVQDYDVGLTERILVDDLSQEQYLSIFNDYTNLPKDEKEAFLIEKDEEFGLKFDPEILLEMVINDFKVNPAVEAELIAIANSSELKWYQIANDIKEAGFPHYHALMLPLIKACEYEIGIQLDNDPLGRQLKLIDGNNDNEVTYPCNSCMNSIFNVDHFSCRKLPHKWDHNDEFQGEDVYPFEEIHRKTKEVLGRSINHLKESVIFYGCNSKNC